MLHAITQSRLLTATLEKTAKEISEKLAANEVSVENFKIQKTELTQDIYRAVNGGYNPSEFKGDKLPVETVSWYDAIKFCNRLSEKQGLKPCYSYKDGEWQMDSSANGWRLPTEEEWVKAADNGHKYSGSDNIDEVAWYGGNSGDKTHEVATKAANANGIYDMSGNVREWCWDKYISSSSYRVNRGGSYYYSSDFCAVSYRDDSPDHLELSCLPGLQVSSLGFRLVRNAN